MCEQRIMQALLAGLAAGVQRLAQSGEEDLADRAKVERTLLSFGDRPPPGHTPSLPEHRPYGPQPLSVSLLAPRER